MEQQTDREVLELARCWFEDIKEKCERLTTGNVSHMGATIRALAKESAEYIDIHCKESINNQNNKAL